VAPALLARRASRDCLSAMRMFAVMLLVSLFRLVQVRRKGAPSLEYKSRSEIFNGFGATTASCSEWKHQVLFEHERKDGKISRCGGTLIAFEWVLSASHCEIEEGDAAFAGVSNREDLDDYAQQTKVVMVENFSAPATGSPDVALVKVTGFEKSACVGPALLPSHEVEVDEGQECVISGWGRTEFFAYPRRLQVGKVSIVANEVCQEEWLGHGEISDFECCALGHDEDGEVVDACKGDSGGPLVCKNADEPWVLYGVTGWGDRTGCGKFPGVFARVYPLVESIKEIMDNN